MFNISAMNELRESIAKNRNRLLSPVLLVIFILCIAVAHWLVTIHAAPVLRAEKILNDIRSKGVENFFAKPQMNFTVTTAAGGQDTWNIENIRFDENNFTYSEIFSQPDSQIGSEEVVAAKDLSKSSYTGRVISPQGTLTTRIDLSVEDNLITVTRSQGRIQMQGQSAIPSNYIPEGMMDLVVRMVSKSSKPASFKMILDSAAVEPRNRGINFIPINLKPMGKNKIERTSPLAKEFRAVYTLDDDGNIILIETSASRTVRVTFQQLLEKFPSQKPFLEKIISSLTQTRENPEQQPPTTPQRIRELI